MLWHPRRRTDAQLRALLSECRTDDLSYREVGCSLDGSTPPGLTRRTWRCELVGHEAFGRAVSLLDDWGVHRGAGLTVVTDGSVEAGTNVVLDAPLPVGFVTATCRVVACVDASDHHGFAYGTLRRHPERGEESFVVRREPSGAVTFEVVALSSPADPVARALPALADRLQTAATRRYLQAMRTGVADG